MWLRGGAVSDVFMYMYCMTRLQSLDKLQLHLQRIRNWHGDLVVSVLYKVSAVS